MPFPGRKKRITDPGYSGLAINEPIDLCLIEEIEWTFGSEVEYTKDTWFLLNNDTEHPTSRIVENKLIFHQPLKADGTPSGLLHDTDDPTQWVEYERIKECKINFGSEEIQDLKTFVLLDGHPRRETDPPIDPKSGIVRWTKTHVKRIFGRAGNWLDVERPDELVVEFGSEEIYDRRVYSIPWLEINPATGNTWEFDFDRGLMKKENPGDPDRFLPTVSPIDLEPDPDDPNVGFDPAWRLDFWQNIVNIMWSRSGTPGPTPDIYNFSVGVRLDWSSFNSLAIVGSQGPGGPSLTVDGDFTVPTGFSGIPNFSEDVPVTITTPRPFLLELLGSGGSTIQFQVVDGDGNTIGGPYTVDFSGVTAFAGANRWTDSSISNAVLGSPTGDGLAAQQTISATITFTNGFRV